MAHYTCHGETTCYGDMLPLKFLNIMPLLLCHQKFQLSYIYAMTLILFSTVDYYLSRLQKSRIYKTLAFSQVPVCLYLVRWEFHYVSDIGIHTVLFFIFCSLVASISTNCCIFQIPNVYSSENIQKLKILAICCPI